MSTPRFEFTRRARPILEVGIGSTVIDEGTGIWDVSLWDAPGSTWNGDEPLWRDVSCDIISARSDLGRERTTEQFRVGTCDIVVDNNSGWADPSTDDFELDSTVGYFSFPGSDGNYVSADDYPALGITGDICIVFRFRTAMWPPATLTQIAGKDGAWLLLITTSGVLQLWTAQGAVITVTQSTLIAPSMDWRWYAVVLDVNNGAGGRDWKWWYGGNDDDPGAWVENESGTAAGVIAINDTANPLVIGSITAVDALDGDVSHLSVRSGFGPGLTVGGTVVFEFNGWDLGDVPRVSAPPMWFLEDPPGSGLYEYAGPPEYLVETPPGSGLYEWVGP